MADQSPADELVHRVRSDLERYAVRARNGLKYVAGVGRPKVGPTPKDVVWARDKVELWRYRSDTRRLSPPLLVVYSLVGRSYVLDLTLDNSVVGSLLKAGVDVFLIDWGVTDELDANNSLETYVDYYLPHAVDAVLEETGAEELSVLGYCAGGMLSLMLTARHAELPIRNLITMATPIDYSALGVFTRLFSDDRIDVRTLLDKTGNLAPEVIRDSLRMLRPTSDASAYATLLQNIWNDENMEAFQAMNQWAKDQIPFPGAAFLQVADMMRENPFVNDTFRLGSRRVSLGDILCPYLNVLAEQDHITPPGAVEPIGRLVGSEDVEEIRLKGGHVGMLASRTAAKVTLPGIVDWLYRHGEEADA
jgi:polyhydroxyalkanoate synthase